MGSRPEITVRRYSRRDQRGMLAAEFVIIQSPRGAPGRRHVMDEDIGAGQQSVERLPVVRLLQVQRDPVLAGVEIKKQAAAFGIGHVIWKRAATPRQVAIGRLDFDHLRAEQRQHLGAEGGRNPFTAFDDRNTHQGQLFCAAIIGAAGL